MTEKTISRTNRVEYFDFLRITAAFAVVVLHVAAQNWPHVAVGSFAWHLFNGLDSITRWGAPVFIMISGALFLDGTQGIRQIITKNILRIDTAFVFWSGVYAMIYYGLGEYSGELAFWRFCTGHYHMWFLWTIAGLYLAVPVLRQIALSETVTKYFLLLALVFNTLLPMLSGMVGILSDHYGSLLSEMQDNFRFGFPMGYVFYFLCGYYLQKTDIGPKMRGWIWLVGICSALFTFGATAAASLWKGEGISLFYNDWSAGSVGMSVAIFVFAKYHCGKMPAWVRKLSRYCFGVYLVHPLVLELLQKIVHLDTLSFHPLIAVPVVILTVTVLSLGISAVLNHIPVVRKYLV